MAISITSAAHAPAPAEPKVALKTQPTSNSKTESTDAKPKAVTSDTVHLSSGSKAPSAASQALQESLETPAQTAKEAGSGDVQAKNLLAKQAAAKVK